MIVTLAWLSKRAAVASIFHAPRMAGSIRYAEKSAVPALTVILTYMNEERCFFFPAD
jgi:hypothetical protein